MKVGALPDGTRGIDCNEPINIAAAKRFYDAGYRFAVRYVPRVARSANDITAMEKTEILLGGLALMIVQHVALPKWPATEQLGTAYGSVAVREARAVGYPKGATLWCDLEETKGTHEDVIAYCNAWYDQVFFGGYEPGLYVGYSAVLTADELYRKLKFRRYWSAYNLDAPDFPAVRGVQMRQGAYPPPPQRVAGISYQYDTNVIKADHFGDSPILLIP